MQTVQEEVRKFVVDSFLFGLDQELSDDASFIDSGIVDSTGILQLVAFIESRYAISIADAELVPDNLDSVQRVSAFVVRKLNGRKHTAA